MKNSYDDDASGDLPDHLFEWAVGNESSAPEGATKVLRELKSSQNKKLQLENKQAKTLNEIADFGIAVTDALEQIGFDADFAVLSEGKIKFSFDDTDHVFDRKRRRLASNVINKLTKSAKGKIVESYMPINMGGGDITVGLLGGVGFSNVSSTGINPDYNPFDAPNVEVVREIDANVDDSVLDRIDELTTMWNGDYQSYDDGVTLTLNEMGARQRGTLLNWIDSTRSRIGMPGSTLEEVLGDIHRRIRRMRSKQE